MTSSKKRSAAAKKANETKARFNRIRVKYCDFTADVVRAVETGKGLDSLRDWYGITSVAAVLANHTRGVYDSI